MSRAEERVLQRLEHQEAIVTSEDWSRLQKHKEIEGVLPEQQIDLEPGEAAEQEAAALRLALDRT